MQRALANRTFVVLVVLGLCFLLVSVAVVLVGIKNIRRLQGQRMVAQRELRDVQVAISGQDKASLLHRQAELSGLLSELGGEVPSAEYVPTLLQQIEQLALNTGNTIKETRPGEYRKGKLVPGSAVETPEAGQSKNPSAGGKPGEEKEQPAGGQRYNELDVQLRLTGSYKSGFELIRQLGFLRRMIYLRNINFKLDQAKIKRPDGEYEGDLTLDLTAYVTEKPQGFPLEMEFVVH